MKKRYPAKASAKVLKDQAKTLKDLPAQKNNAGAKPPRTTTGHWLVRLDPQASTTVILRQASAASLNLISSQELPPGNEGILSQALQKQDGILFTRLKIALISQAATPRLKTAQAQRNTCFLSAEPDRILRALQASSKNSGNKKTFKDTAVATWGIHAINTSLSSYTGKKIKLAILDTGFDFTHPDFAGRTIHRKSFVGTRQAKDKEGHGTHCAGIAAGGHRGKTGRRYGVAPGTHLYIGKILDDSGEGSDGSALAGIEWALEKGCQVISMSFGAPVHADDPYSLIYEEVAQSAMKARCLLIAASGNESLREESQVVPVNHPANCPSIIAVGALTESLEVSDYSCAGNGSSAGQIDIAAPGDNILSLAPGGKYRRESGTSMATAFVAGLAALLWEQYPDEQAAGIWLKLTQKARRLNLPASDVGVGLAYVR